MKKIIVSILSVTCMLTLSLSAQAKSTATVTARVVSGTGAIQAVLQPVEFTVPSGKTATIKSFYFKCPKSGVERKKLGKNIYCITTGKYMIDAKNTPLMTLSAGKYRFFVGGSPGAFGTLVYELNP